MSDARTDPIQPDWIEYWKNYLRVLADNGLVCMPLRGVLYRIDKTKKKVYQLWHVDAFTESDTDIMTCRILGVLGYSVDTTNSKTGVEELKKALGDPTKQNYMIDEKVLKAFLDEAKRRGDIVL